MATPRSGKPYVWVTWLAKMLGGDQCLYSLWFKARFKYQKREEEGEQLAEWNRDHARLIRDRRRDLEEAGYSVTVEDQNQFKVEGETAIVAGKPDLIARKGDEVLIVDGKTGRRRDSDIWQVLLYLWAIPRSRPDITGRLEGEIQYKRGDECVTVTSDALTKPRLSDIVTMIKVVTASTPPSKAPSRFECQRCNIAECADRFTERKAEKASVSAGF